MKKTIFILSLLACIGLSQMGVKAQTFRAKRGNKEAQYELGYSYYGRNHSKAIYWFTKAAEQGHAGAMHKLGEYYYSGLMGVIKDNTKAIYWFTKAAEQGDRSAMHKLGECYYYGLMGVIKDDTKALYWYEKENDYYEKGKVLELKARIAERQNSTDPYYKKINIPADLEAKSKAFLQSSCSSIEFTWGNKKEGAYYDIYMFEIPKKYTTTETRTETYDDGYYTTERVITGYDKEGDPRYGTKEVYHSRTSTRDRTVIAGANKETQKIKEKLIYQKAYNECTQIIKKYQNYDDEQYQNMVKRIINSKYSDEEYKKYLEKKEEELEQLKKEWKAVPLYDKEIEIQAARTRSTWIDYKQERENQIIEFDSQCQVLLEAKRFVYKYEHDIP